MKVPLILATISFALISCEPKWTWSNKDNKGYGYVPVYIKKEDAQDVSIKPPKTTAIPGKIYAYGSYIFQNDIGTGVHIINNLNKQNPFKTGFLNIPFNYEIAIKDSCLYANSSSDLLVFDLKDLNNPKVINRINGVFPSQNINNYPNESNVYFECVDTSKGVVVGWKKQNIVNKNCYR